MEPLRGQGLAVLKPDLIGALVDAYYGGKGEPPVHRLPDFTPAEDRVIQALLERMFAALNAAWADVFDLQFSRIRSEEHTSELQSLMRISYAVFCLKKKNTICRHIQSSKH